MASTNSLTPTQAPNTSIISPLTQDFPLENITLSYSPPPENSLANNELPDNSTSIEQLDTSTNIDIKEENRSAKTDVDALILNENPAPKIESISENNPTENSQIDPITGEIIQPENPNPTAYTSGIFTVDSTGKISIEYLSDGGSYQGELAIFSLEGLEKLVPDSPELRLEAASRALSNSPLGYIAISDITEAAKYSNLSGEENPNAGEYKGIKTFTMKPGDKIGIMLVPNGTVREVYENPNIGGDKQPLFSMATANSSDAEAAGQIASADSNGIFVMEDMPIASSDRDLNDIIFAFKGAAPQVISMDELIGSNTDWRTSEAGKKLIADAAPKSETKLDDKKPDTISTTNPPETKTETTPAIEAKNPTVSETPNPVTTPAQTKTDSPAIETKNSTVSETPNPVTTPVETKTDSPAIETKNSTVSEIPNPVTIPSETKTETSLTTATQNPTVSSISNFPINPVATEIDLITGNTLETPVFLQPNEPETPTIIPAAATDILTGEIENNSPTFTDSLETTSENAENFPPLSDEEIARFWENLNRIWAEADENSENSEPSESEYLIPNTDSDAENPTYTPDIGVTENYQPTNTENTTSFDSIEGEEWDADTTESATTAIISETTTPANDPPETSGTPIPDSASNYETNSNESAVADTDSELETTSDSSQATKPLIGIIDTGFAANNPNIDYNNIVLGKDLIDNDSNPLIQPNENNQHGTTILEIIAGDNNKNETPIWLGRATGSGNWHQSLIEFTNAVKAAKQPNAVVNLSFDLTQINPDGTQTTRHKLTAEERLALQYAKDNNILIVAAAGNEGNLLSALGQASNEFDNIITVGAAENNYRAGYSSYGEGLDILAAGDIPQTTETATTETKQGTSIAAAKVTNTISQMWAANPSLDYQQIKNILLNTAKDIDVPDWDERTGYGILNSELAIATAAEAIPTIPVLAAAKLLTKPLINATENIGNSPNSTPEKPSERATATTSTAPGTPKITSTSTGDYNVGTNSYTRDVAPYKTTTTSSSNGTTTTNSRILSSLANTESNWDRSTTKTNHKAESFDESTSDSTTNASTYTSKTFSQNSTENKNQWQENRSRVKHEGTRSDSSESAQKSRGSYNYTTPTYTRNDASESYRNSKSQSNSQFGTNLSIFNGDRQDDWGSKSTTNTRTNNGNNVSTANSATQTAGNAKWTNGSSGNTSNSTHSGEETTVNTSNSTNSNSSGFSKSSSSNDNYSVVNSTWDNTTNGGVAVNTNTRDFYSESNSNSQSSYDDGKTKNTSDRDSYNVSKSEQTNSSQGSTYRQNNRHNNYSESRGNDTQTYKDGPYNNRRTTDSYSITRSDGYSANSSGKITSQNNSETFSGNYIQDENEYKVDAYTTTSRGDDETITSTRSSSSNDGTNNTSSSSSDTVRTRNGQTVTVYKNGLKNENENSSYQRWWSETATDRGQSATTNGYESWSSSYTRSEFKGGYSWSETISGTNTTSVTKGGTTTSKQSNWSWTRSGTVWDDGRNSWNESWSKSNWENGKSIPGESETARGSYDPKGTGTQTNNLPEAGDAPRLTKPPKNVVELNKQPKYKPQPSQELWTTPLPTPPRVIENPPDNQFAGSGAPPKGNLPQNKINALKDVIQRLLSFFRPLGEFVAGAVYQWLRNNGDLGRWLLQVFIPGWNGLDQDVERNLPKTWAFQTGRTFGDGAAIVTGILEMIAGGGAAAGGSSLCITGFGCIGGAPALVAGTALALHGSTTASRGLSNILAGIAENLGVVFQSSSGSNGGDRAYEPPARSIPTYEGGTRVEWRPTSNEPRPAVVVFQEVNPGIIEVSDIYRRDLPSGSGGRMIADALRTNGINRPSTIRLTNVQNTATTEAMSNGIALQDTLLGNTLKNAIREMGGTPTNWTTGQNYRGQLWIEVKISY